MKNGFASYLFDQTRYEKITRQKSAQNDLPYPFTGLKVIGWGGGGILGLGLGLDNSANKYFHISLKYIYMMYMLLLKARKQNPFMLI